MIVGGDVIAGPFPLQSLELLDELAIPTRLLLGNAESETLRCVAGRPPRGLSARADEEAQWLAQQLPAETLHAISRWPATIELDMERWGRVLFCHATPESDTRVFTERTPEATLASEFSPLRADLVVCGHTHMQFDRRIAGVRVVNAGSVGMPFGRSGADWLILGDALDFRHTEYDLEDAARRIRTSVYPHAETFAAQSVLSPPSQDQAHEMLTHLEQQQPN